MAGDVDDIRARLEAIAEELADAALDRLRTGVDAADDLGRAAAASDERRLTRARRAVERAAALLRDDV